MCLITFTAPNAPPADVEGFILNVTSIWVLWGYVPAADQNGIIVNYTVTYKQLPDGSPEIKVVNAPTREMILTGLTENTNYSIAVFASTSKGSGNISSPVIVVTDKGRKLPETL